MSKMIALALLFTVMTAAPEPLLEAVGKVRIAAAKNEEADLNNDRVVTLDDLRLLARDLSTLVAAYRGDVNNDLYVNGADLNLLAARLLAAAGRDTDEATIASLVTGCCALETELPGPGGPVAFPVAGSIEAATADTVECGTGKR